jgi:hypothetical protein
MSADDVAFGADALAELVTGDAGAEFGDAADEFMADHQARLDRALAPVVPQVDVQVGAADRGLFQLDQDFVRTGHGHRHVFHPDAFAGLAFYQRLHRRCHRLRRRGGRELYAPAPAGFVSHAEAQSCARA